MDMRDSGVLQKFSKKRSLYLVLVVLLVIIALQLFGRDADTVSEAAVTKPLVSVGTAADYTSNDSITLIGTVRAFTEAQITADRAGRVTNVAVTLGSVVLPGQIIATLENASERASLLQAEGVYEAAIAGSAQSSIGLNSAENTQRTAQADAISSINGAYTTVSSVIVNSIDQFFSTPNATIPGLRIDGRGYTDQLNRERVAFQTSLPEWQTAVAQLSTASDLKLAIAEAQSMVSRTTGMVDTFIIVLNNQSNSSRYSESELLTLSSTFSGIRSNLLQTTSALNAALANLNSAEDAVRQASLAASGATVSASDAQVKQALGALRAAEANLAKTILRSPIRGTVNSLSVQSGDYISGLTNVAVIANNAALEVVTFASDRELERLTVGDTVLIEGVHEGVVTQIAPAVNQQTKKTEVRIATENSAIKNGQTVVITARVATTTASATQSVQVPITAVKFEVVDGFVYVVTDGKLEKRPVTIGLINGNSVEIVDGLTATEPFVLDARGLIEGTEVTVR